MSERRLSVAELAVIAEDNRFKKGDGYITADETRLIVDELRELRALLATPMPCGWPDITAEDGEVHDGPNDLIHDPDEAIALGAALIRAALAARGDK